MIYAGTGHRPDKLGGYSDAVTNELVTIAKANIQDASKVISGMALGWDTALAIAAFELKIPFIAAVPFKGQERLWPTRSQKRFNELLDCAEEVIFISSPGYAPWKMQHRNKWMVDNCDVVLALWNGSDGGTANCVRYAQEKNKLIKNVWDQFNV